MAASKRLPIPPLPHRGGCLCGAVRYRVDTPPLSVSACHCVDCKKLSGAPFGAMITALREGFVHEQGEIQVYPKQADSGRVVEVARCAACGSRVWHVPQLGPQYILFPAGTLDDSSWATPTAHIWAERAAPGTEFSDECLVVQGQPADRQGMIDAFKRICGG